MSGGAFDAVSVVDTALACFVVDIKVLEVVVEVDGASAKIAAEKSRVSGEDGGYVDVSLATERDCETGLPFVEVGNYGLVKLTGDILRGRCQ